MGGSHITTGKSHKLTFTVAIGDILDLCHTQTCLHTAAFAHRSSDTQKLLQTLLHTETLTHKQLCTFTHRCSYHTDAFTYTCFYTQKHFYTHTHRDALRGPTQICKKKQFIALEPHFMRNVSLTSARIATLPSF